MLMESIRPKTPSSSASTSIRPPHFSQAWRPSTTQTNRSGRRCMCVCSATKTVWRRPFLLHRWKLEGILHSRSATYFFFFHATHRSIVFEVLY
jgi:hypothetical protein